MKIVRGTQLILGILNDFGPRLDSLFEMLLREEVYCSQQSQIIIDTVVAS